MTLYTYRQLRARRALSLFKDVLLITRIVLPLFKDVPLITRRALSLFIEVKKGAITMDNVQ